MMVKLSEATDTLLRELNAADDRGAFCIACDGPFERASAHELGKLGLAEWRGTSYGSSFWSITEAGRAALKESDNG